MTHIYTADLARAVGVHPNTVRLYEAWGFLAPAPRTGGYRLFTLRHLAQIELARLALSIYPQSDAYHHILAEVYVKNGDKALAIETLKQCLALNPGHPYAREALERLL